MHYAQETLTNQILRGEKDTEREVNVMVQDFVTFQFSNIWFLFC